MMAQQALQILLGKLVWCYGWLEDFSKTLSLCSPNQEWVLGLFRSGDSEEEWRGVASTLSLDKWFPAPTIMAYKLWLILFEKRLAHLDKDKDRGLG